MIELSGVSRIYRTETVETWALAAVDLSIGAGEFVAIAGPSGSGKSTLLGILGLLDCPSSGSYRLSGEEMAAANDRRAAQVRRETMGFVFQQFNLIDDLTVAENVDLALAYRGFSSAERRGRVSEALEQVGLSSRKEHRPSQLSGGQQQRVAIARAIVGRPSILFADEPTGNLDSQTGAEVLGLLRQLNTDGMTLIMVTHDRHQADQANRQIWVRDGRLES